MPKGESFMNNIEKNQLGMDILKKIYEKLNGKLNAVLPNAGIDIVESFSGIENEKIIDCIYHLESEGYIKAKSHELRGVKFPYSIEILKKGIDLIEKK